MTISSMLKTAAIAAGAVALAMAAQAQGAAAQSWDWGGGSSVGGSGRTTVRFAPQFKPGMLVVSFSDRRLYHVTRPGEANSYPIATPREQSRWQGAMTVTQKRVNPSWTPTPSMRAENPRLPMWVPGGHPMNPLGNRALYLGSSAYRIHGTDAPWTIGTPVSKGCIRMYNQDVAELYERVPVGANVLITFQRFDGGAPVAVSETQPPSAARPIRTTYRAKKYVSAE
jgi:lipoprotein-anchoring transpeptidase ErfK/SrfK